MEQQHIVITGGSKGLGLECTRTLLEQGAQVYVLSRSPGQLAELQTRYPSQLHWLAADMGSISSLEQAFTTLAGLTPRLDALVLNAALTAPMQLSDMDAASVEQNLLVNIAGPIACMRQALPLLRNGRAIFISSESVEHPFPMLSLYAAMKAAMEMLFRALRQEMLSQHNIKLSVLRAGSMAGTAFSESWSPEALAKFFAMAQASGELGNSGTAMPVARVVNAVEFLLRLPADANVNLMDLRSGDSV